MRRDGQTDRYDRASSLFRTFANAPKNCYIIALLVVMRHLKNFSKLSYSAWYRIVMLVQYIVKIKDFSLRSVNFVSIFCHPKQMSYALCLF